MGPAKEPTPCYPDGLDGLSAYEQTRRAPFVYMPEDLPAVDVDLAALKEQIVPDLGPYDRYKPHRSDFYGYKQRMYHDFAGKSELSFLVSCLVMMSRRALFPKEMCDLWYRIWTQEAAYLREEMNLRWKISALKTFGFHGRSEAERQVGRELFLLTGMMKISDTERSFSGKASDERFAPGNRSKKSFRQVALGMVPYSITDGDLDRIMLVQIYDAVQKCKNSPVYDLAMEVLDAINTRDDTVFRRLTRMRAGFLKKSAAQQRKNAR